MSQTFGAAELLASLGISGTFATQSTGEDNQLDEAFVADGKGNVIADTPITFNDRTEYSVTLKPSTPATPLTLTLGGQGNSGIVITKCSVQRKQNDYPTVNITAHKHRDTAADHVADVANENAWDISVDLNFGCEDAGALISADESVLQSQTVDYDVQHKDRQTGAGDHLIGNSYRLTVSCTEDCLTDAEPANQTGWIYDSKRKQTENEDFQVWQLKAHRYDVPTGG